MPEFIQYQEIENPDKRKEAIRYTENAAEDILSKLFYGGDDSRFSLKTVSSGRKILLFDEKELRQGSMIFEHKGVYVAVGELFFNLIYEPVPEPHQYKLTCVRMYGRPSAFPCFRFTGRNAMAIKNLIGAEDVDIVPTAEYGVESAYYTVKGETFFAEVGDIISDANHKWRAYKPKEWNENHRRKDELLLFHSDYSAIEAMSRRFYSMMSPTIIEEERDYLNTLRGAQALIEMEIKRVEEYKKGWEQC